MWTVTAAASLIGSGGSLFVLTQGVTGGGTFGWHPILMWTGAALLVPSAVFAVQARRSAPDAKTKSNCILAHAVLQTSAIACLSAGIAAIYSVKEANNRPHFTSKHSWIGLAALGSILGATGYASFRTITNKFSWMWRDDLHRLGGLIGVGLATAAVCTGIVHERWVPDTMNLNTRMIMAGTAVFAAGVAVAGFVDAGEKKKKKEGHDE
jgi:hypothetical protein